jgi:predicted nucleic acid-binding protein
MDIVTDTNIFLAVALGEPEKDEIVRLTVGCSAAAPEILPYEIGNALSAMVKRRKLSEAEALEAQRTTSRIAVRLISVDVRMSLQIALAQGIYAYDAYFLECARMLSRPLLTLDRRMRQAAGAMGIKLLECSP